VAAAAAQKYIGHCWNLKLFPTLISSVVSPSFKCTIRCLIRSSSTHVSAVNRVTRY
jgi:hypothetical protein